MATSSNTSVAEKFQPFAVCVFFLAKVSLLVVTLFVCPVLLDFELDLIASCHDVDIFGVCVM
jgi:hypothetical protein